MPLPAADVPAPKTSRTPLWRNVSFTLMWSSTAASGFGDRMMMLAAAALLGISLEGAQASSIQAGINFWFFLPYFFLGVVGGWIADTLPRKWVLFSCDELRGLLLLSAVLMVPATAVGAAIPDAYHWRIFAMLFAVGFFASVFTPTRNATIPQIVPMKQLPAANGVIMGIAVVFSLLGMGVGGWLIDGENASTVRTGLLIGACLYLCSGTFFIFLKPRAHKGSAIEKKNELQRLGEAVHYITSHKRILRMVLLSMLFWGAAYVVFNAIAAFTKDRWYDPATDDIILRISILSMCVGLGMLLGAVLMAVAGSRRESFWFGMLAMLISAGCMVGLAICPYYWLAIPLCVVVGLFGNMALVVINTLTQNLSANYVRGRVFGLRDVTDNASNITVNLVIWLMPGADSWMFPTLIATAGILAVISIYGLMREMVIGYLPTKTLNVIIRIIHLWMLVYHHLEVYGKHNIPRTGPVLLCPNHTTGLDPFVLQPQCPRLIRWLMLTSYRFPLAEPLWKRIEPICLDQNDSDMSKIREVIRTLKQDQVVGFFPEGSLQREKRELQEFREGIGMIARRSGAWILPAWIHGTPRKHSMLWHFLWPSRSSVTFGEPFKADGMKDEQVREELRRRLMKLSQQADAPLSHTP